VRIPIPDHIRSAIINAWMSGKSRDKIAPEVNISTGSVSNIIEQWQNKIGVFDAKNLRELGLALKKAGITPVQCANGLRINNILNQLGIDDDHLFDFLKKLYNESKEQKLSPADLARLVKVINAYPGINSLNELPNKIKKRQQEKIKLDADIYYKKLEIQKLDNEKEKKRKEVQDLQEELESFRKEMREEKKDFMLFKDAKAELKKHGISIHILEPLIDVIKIFDDLHFRPLTILSEFSDINEYRDLVKNKNRELKELESLIQNLKDILDSYEKKIASNQIIVQSLNKWKLLGLMLLILKN
jgi:methyl-accepting chemotaxis protein